MKLTIKSMETLMKQRYIIIFFFSLFIGCKTVKKSNSFDPATTITSKKELTKSELQTWHQKDYVTDGIPGIALDKWYLFNKNKPKTKSIIVAVIDTQIDLNHEDLRGQFWTNNKEIPDNGIDDDNNGYIDDINGWNFIGTKNGGHVVWGNYELARIIRNWGPLVKDKTESQIDAQNLYKYKEYQRALKKLEEENKYFKNWLKSLNFKISVYPLVKDTLKYYFPKEDYTYQQLDSMYKKYKINDKTYRQRRDDKDKDLGALIDYMMVSLEVNQKTLEDILKQKATLDSIIDRNLNINYNERLLIADNPDVFEKGYGNNNMSINKVEHRPVKDHCTKMAGVIAANRKNNKGTKGIIQDVKIMPLTIIPFGDEHDKDIAMAIRYAVDNGAKIINMSFGKEFSLHREWVFEAIKYAEEHNVLLVHGAGNDGFDIDENPMYPNDTDFESFNEISSNFISVGSVSCKLDSTFVSDFSNYGKQNVDLFAPGEEIYSTGLDNSYKFDSGTSMATPMVSGTAALIWSYYPNLTAAKVKEIIMNSGTAYDLEVIVPGTKDKKVPFSELSKSGKVLNVYNAMQLAEKVSKERR